jgi:hypothetical protein
LIHLDLQSTVEKKVKQRKNETVLIHETEVEKLPVKTEKIVAHDALTPEQVDELKHKNSQEHGKLID